MEPVWSRMVERPSGGKDRDQRPVQVGGQQRGTTVEGAAKARLGLGGSPYRHTESPVR